MTKMYNFTNEQEFNKWLSNIPSVTQNLFNRFPDSLKTKLTNNDFEALLEISEWVLQNVKSIEELKNNPELWNEVSCYIGEVSRKILNGKWTIELENEDYVFFKSPTIESSVPSPICPMNLVTALLSRQNSSFIPKIIEKKLERQKVL